jgi:NDP-sugar pyrophosphorylase family protein
MGIYVLEPEALEYIPPAVHFDLPDLVHALLRAHEPVHTYHYDGLWFDIGRRDDYEQAAAAWAENPVVGDGGPDAPSRDAALPVTAAVTNGSGGS